jgi:hypothetical protein
MFDLYLSIPYSSHQKYSSIYQKEKPMQTLSPEYLEALDFRAKVLEHYNAFLLSDKLDMAHADKVRQSVPPGLYEHFKSKLEDCKFYIVTGVGFQQTTNIPTVYYTSLYGANAGQPTDRRLLVKEDGFLTPVKREDVHVGRRFTMIQTLTPEEIFYLLQNIKTLSQIKNAEEIFVRIHKMLQKS